MSDKYNNTIQNFKELLPTRFKIINSSAKELNLNDPVYTLAKKLHPKKLNLVIADIYDENKNMKTIKLIPNPKSNTINLPIFKPGQYLSIKEKINDCLISRPYSISSSPKDALEGSYYTITIKKKENGFFTNHIWNNWKIGTEVLSSEPVGFFTYNPIRDSKDLVGLCGGCGVTPMHSMIRHIVQNNLPLTFTLFYGINNPEEIAFKKNFEEYEKLSNGKFKVIYVCSTNLENWDGEVGFLSSFIIKKYIDPKDKTFFVCGPVAMYKFLDRHLTKLEIENRRIRREVLGEDTSFLIDSELSKDILDKEFTITVKVGLKKITIPALGKESILVALEKSGVVCPSQCRSGECGFCRSKLLKGYVNINPSSDKRRIADIMYNYIHPCSTYPLSDLEIELPSLE